MKKACTIFLLLFGAHYLLAQEASNTSGKGSSSIGLYSLNLGFGFYNPGFDYWEARTPFDFSGGIMPNAQAEFTLLEFGSSNSQVTSPGFVGGGANAAIRSRLSVGWFSNTAKITRIPTWGEESLSTQLIPVSLSALGYFYGGSAGFYGGAGVDVMSVSTTYTSPTGSNKGSGSTTTGHILAGIEASTLSRLKIAVEGRYYLGSFGQTISVFENADPFVEDISLNGWSLGLLLKFMMH